MERLTGKLARLIEGQGFQQADACQKEIKALGGWSHVIGNGEAEIDLAAEIFFRTLLGVNSEFSSQCLENFSPYEKELFEKGNPQILALLDFDGVFVSPFHAALEKKGVKLGLKNLLFLRKIAATAEQTILWTSRFDLAFPFSKAKISYFPLLDQNSAARLEKLGRGKLSVVRNKNLLNPRELLEEIISQYKPDITYYLGSSQKDRRMALEFLKENCSGAEKFIFLDTAHIFL